MEDHNKIIVVDDVTMCFNLAEEKTDSIKEYKSKTDGACPHGCSRNGSVKHHVTEEGYIMVHRVKLERKSDYFRKCADRVKNRC